MQYIDTIELNRMREAGEKIAVIDIREAYELDICKIDAIHIPMGEVSDRVNEIPKDIPATILCRSGKRALAVANLLVSDYGLENISVVEGGILAWIEKVDSQLEAY